MSTRSISAAEFGSVVVDGSHTRPVVVDFWAPWCGPCHQLAPLLEEVAASYADRVDVVKLDVDTAPAIAQTYRIQGIPAVKGFRAGQVVAEFTGVQPPAAIARFFDELAPSPAEELLGAARTAAGPERERLLRAALEIEPGHRDATVALARELLDRAAYDEVRTLLAPLVRQDDVEATRLDGLAAGAGADLEELQRAVDAGTPGARIALGRALAARGDADTAIEMLISEVRTGDREAARVAVLEVFALLGDADPVVRTWRPRLAAALF